MNLNWLTDLVSVQKGSNYGSLMTMEGNFQIYTKTGYYKVCHHLLTFLWQTSPAAALGTNVTLLFCSAGKPGSHQVYQEETHRTDQEGPVWTKTCKNSCKSCFIYRVSVLIVERQWFQGDLTGEPTYRSTYQLTEQLSDQSTSVLMTNLLTFLVSI